MLTARELRRREVLWNVSSMKETAGANMEEARGEMKVMLDSKERSSHFLESGKLRGISGSSCDSHPTIPALRSEIGSFARVRRSFLLFDVKFVAIRDSLLLVLALLAVVETRWISSDLRAPALIDATV
jgi:hypothetical protein